MHTAIDWVSALERESQFGLYPDSTDYKIWRLLIEDVKTLDPQIIRASRRVMVACQENDRYWEPGIIANMVTFLTWAERTI